MRERVVVESPALILCLKMGTENENLCCDMKYDEYREIGGVDVHDAVKDKEEEDRLPYPQDKDQ